MCLAALGAGQLWGVVSSPWCGMIEADEAQTPSILLAAISCFPCDPRLIGWPFFAQTKIPRTPLAMPCMFFNPPEQMQWLEGVVHDRFRRRSSAPAW